MITPWKKYGTMKNLHPSEKCMQKGIFRMDIFANQNAILINYMNSQERTNKLRNLAHSLIPSGAHTYSRADNQFPICAPAFVSKAKGCKFWDENDCEYIDYSMGLLSVSVGHANEIINNKVIEALSNGTSYARPSLIEAQLAEKINALIPSAEMVKFAKNGSDVTSAAIRLARNYTILCHEILIVMWRFFIPGKRH